MPQHHHKYNFSHYRQLMRTQDSSYRFLLNIQIYSYARLNVYKRG